MRGLAPTKRGVPRKPRAMSASISNAKSRFAFEEKIKLSSLYRDESKTSAVPPTFGIRPHSRCLTRIPRRGLAGAPGRTKRLPFQELPADGPRSLQKTYDAIFPFLAITNRIYHSYTIIASPFCTKQPLGIFPRGCGDWFCCGLFVEGLKLHEVLVALSPGTRGSDGCSAPRSSGTRGNRPQAPCCRG